MSVKEVPGKWLNINDSIHIHWSYGDKTVLRQSCLHNRKSFMDQISCHYCHIIIIIIAYHTVGLVQDFGNSIANAVELPQSCTKSLIYYHIMILPCQCDIVNHKKKLLTREIFIPISGLVTWGSFQHKDAILTVQEIHREEIPERDEAIFGPSCLFSGFLYC